MKRVLKIFAIVTGAMAVLMVGGTVLAYTLVDLNKVITGLVAKHKPEIEKQLGRKVEVGRITTTLFPSLSARVEGLMVAPDPTQPQDDRPLVKIDAVGFDVAIWKALFSLGKQIGIKTVYVEGLRVSVLRYHDGRLSYQDILDRMASAPQEDKPAEPLSPEVQAMLQGVSIGEIRLSDGQIRLVDFATPTGTPVESTISKLDVRLADVRLSRPIHLQMAAAVFSETPNLRFEAIVGPLPPDLKVVGLPRVDLLGIKAQAVDLGRLAPYLGPAVPVAIDSASFSADWKLSTAGADKPLAIAGSLTLDRLQLHAGEPFDVRLASHLTFDPQATSVRIEKLELAVGEVSLVASGALLDLATKPRFEAFTLRSSTLAPGRLLAYLPPLRASLPPGTRITGAALLDVAASGDAAKQSLQARLDAGPLDVLLPGLLVKPAGVPMGLHFDGDLTQNDVTIRRLGLRLSELDLGLQGKVSNFAQPVLDLDAASKPFGFDALARLLPAVQKALASSPAKASGDGKITAHIKGSAQRLDGALDLSLLGVKLDAPGMRLLGDLRLQAEVKGNPSQDVAAHVLFDADRATIQVKDALNKTPATPMRFEMAATRKGDLVEVAKLVLRLAELRIDADGRFDLAKGTSSARVVMPKLDLEKLARTVTAIDPAKARKGFIEATIALRGNPQKLDTMELALAPFAAQLAGSDLHGEIRLQNLLKPRAEIRLASNRLDIDALNGGPSGAGAASGKAKATPTPAATQAPVQDDPSLKDYRVHALVEAGKVIVSQTTLEDFRGEIELVDGVLKLGDCSFRAFDGTISARGTEAEIWRGRMPFKANLAIKGIDINKVLSAKTRFPNTLYGKGDLDVRVSGVGFETADLERHLFGQLGVMFKEGRFARASLTESVVGSSLTALQKIPGLSTKAIGGDNTFRNLSTMFEVKDGRMNMRQPIDFSLDGNRVQIGGGIGIAGKLFLSGTYFLRGRLLEQMTGGKCGAMADLPVPLQIGGAIDTPRFSADGKTAARPVAEQCLKAGAGVASQAISAKAQKMGVPVPAAAEIDAQAKAAAEQAQVLQAEAEQRAKAEADRVRAEAERTKAEAERRVKEEAAKQSEAAKKGFGEKMKRFGL